MIYSDIKIFQDYIKLLHGCDSEYEESVAVTEKHNGRTIWNGNVEVFNLLGHPHAKRCYAWAYDLANDLGTRIVVVLKTQDVATPEAAVRTMIASESKKRHHAHVHSHGTRPGHLHRAPARHHSWVS